MANCVWTVSAALLIGTFLSPASWANSGTARIVQNPSGKIGREATVQKDSDMTAQQQDQLRFAAENLLEHINAARLALAFRDKPTAQAHVNSALVIAAGLENASPEYRTKTKVQSGKFTYEFDDVEKSHYVPVAGDVIAMKEITTGPFWSKNEGKAVKDVELVYVSIDVNVAEATDALLHAQKELEKDQWNAAQDTLQQFVEKTLKAETVAELPVEKARDNLALTKAFLQNTNYDAARHSLSHAEDALEEMEKDERYADRKQMIAHMHQAVDELKTHIENKDPQALDKAKEKVQSWWMELKSWSERKM